jgi:hypothetical protein
VATYMQSAVAVYLPSSDSKGYALTDERLAVAADYLAQCLCERWQGFTEMQARGGWIGAATGALIREDVRILRTFVARFDADDASYLESIARIIGRTLDQESMAIESPEGFGLVNCGD